MKLTGEKQTVDKAEESLSYSVKEGSASSIMTGIGETFINPFAISIGASTFQIGLLKTLPNLGSALFQPLAANIMDATRRRKSMLMWAVILQALLWLPLVANAIFFKNIYLLLVIFGLYGIFDAFMAPAWFSWMGDLVEPEKRGRYFSMRSRITGIVSFVATFIGGILLQYIEGRAAFMGFALLFSIACIARLFSWHYFRHMQEPPYFAKNTDSLSFADFILKLPYTSYGRFCIFLCLMSFAVNLAAPFFAVYMLRDLGLDYFSFTVITLSSTLVTFLVITYWGKHSDDFGNKRIFTITGFLLPLLPFLWLLSANFYFILAVQIFSGFVWAGFNLATGNYFYDAVVAEHRAKTIAYYNSLNGIAIFAGAIMGGLIAPHLIFVQGALNFRSELLVLFLLSGFLRLVLALIMLPLINDISQKTLEEKEHELFVRLIALEPSKMLVGTMVWSLEQTRNTVGKIGYKRRDFHQQNVFSAVKKK